MSDLPDPDEQTAVDMDDQPADDAVAVDLSAWDEDPEHRPLESGGGREPDLEGHEYGPGEVPDR